MLDRIFARLNEAGRTLASANRLCRPKKKEFSQVRSLLKTLLPNATITESVVDKVTKKLYGKRVNGFRRFLESISAKGEGVLIGVRIGSADVTLKTASDEDGILAKVALYTSDPNDPAPQLKNARAFKEYCWPEVIEDLKYLGGSRFGLSSDEIIFSDYLYAARYKVEDGLPEFYGENDCQITSWINTVAMNAFLNVLRARKKLEPQDVFSDLVSASTEIRLIELRRFLDSLIASVPLSEMDRKIADLWREDEDRTNAEIAARVGKSSNYVKNRKFRMASKLRHALQKEKTAFKRPAM